MVELNREELYQQLEEMENDLRLYPIEDGLEDDIIDYINGKELTEKEKWDLENRLEDFFYGAKLKCRKPTYYFTDGFEFYVTEIYIDLRILEHVKKSFPKFHQLSVSSEIEQGYSTLSVKLTLWTIKITPDKNVWTIFICAIISQVFVVTCYVDITPGTLSLFEIVISILTFLLAPITGISTKRFTSLNLRRAYAEKDRKLKSIPKDVF